MIRETGKKYPATWKVHFDEKLHKDGSYYYFSVCPICSYLTGIGLGEIMKPLCETDRVMFAYSTSSKASRITRTLPLV